MSKCENTAFHKRLFVQIKDIWACLLLQRCHGEFEPGKAQYSTSNFFDRLFLIRAYLNPKSRQGPGLGSLAIRGAPEFLSQVSGDWYITTPFLGRVWMTLSLMPVMTFTKMHHTSIYWINVRVSSKSWVSKILITVKLQALTRLI